MLMTAFPPHLSQQMLYRGHLLLYLLPVPSEGSRGLTSTGYCHPLGTARVMKNEAAQAVGEKSG